MFLKTVRESIFKNKLAIFLIVFLLLVICSIYGSPKVYALLLCNEEMAGEKLECNNGPNNTDSNGCGLACGSFEPWTKYVCKYNSIGFWGWSYLGPVCSTADKCIPGEKGLHPGYCDCGSSGPLYKTCCSGSTPTPCNRYYQQDNYDPPEGTCAPNSWVWGSSCTSSSPPSNSGTCLVYPYNNACPKGYVLSGGCCICP